MKLRSILAAAVTLCLLAGFSFAGDEKETKKHKPAEPKKPVYDETADAKKQIESALAAAKRENRRVLIQWGANWCSWCVLLHDRFKTDRALAKTLRYEYDVVLVDVGKMDKNADLVSRYEADFKQHGIPYLTILDADGKVVVNQPTNNFETKDGDKKGHDPKKLQEFLAKHQATPRNANEVLKAALDEAAKSDRKVFLHFGAPWCGWCLRLDAWLARPEIAGIVAKDFVEVKIDQDRMTDAKEVFSRFRPSPKGGIPWLVFLDSKGQAIITSDGPKGNIGFPAEDHEVDHFVKMLETAKKNMKDADIEELRKSLAKPAQQADK